MIKSILKRTIGRFEKHYGYNAAYMHDIIAASTRVGAKLAVTSSFLSERFDAPRDICFAVKIRSTLRADCGPCLRLSIQMAEESGLESTLIRSILSSQNLSPEIEFAMRFADAVLDNAAELPELTEQMRERYGDTTLYGLAIAINAGQFYPLLKRSMGHAVTCEPVVRDYLAATKEEADIGDRHGRAA